MVIQSADKISDILQGFVGHIRKRMKIKFFLALMIALFFYVRTDIFIWQRIFEENELWELGMGTYHRGWLQSLYGFMVVGALLFLPNLKYAISFPISLWFLAYPSGLEDVLYYWLDGRLIPATLPWLSTNPWILHPVTAQNLLISVSGWVVIIVVINLAWMDR